MVDKEFVKNVDYSNKTKSEPLPSKMNDIDVDGDFYTALIDNTNNNTLDTAQINAFSNVAMTRDRVYDLLDLMGADPIISTALDIYASDACEPNEEGKIIWATSKDDKVAACVNSIIDGLELDKNTYGWIYSLIKYGDLYLRLYRQSEFNVLNDKKPLNEDIIVKAFSKNDRYSNYMGQIKNPAEAFELKRLGKTSCFIQAHINHRDVQAGDVLNNGQYSSNSLMHQYRFKKNDVDIYEATELVHACLDNNQTREEETVTIFNDNSDDVDASTTYTVRRGQSILYNSFKIWRELQLLENSVLLNRLTQSSVVRAIGIETGDMEKNDAKNYVSRVKMMIEQKSAINANTSLSEYTSPGPIQNTIYIPIHDGKGALSIQNIGGDVNVGDLTDLDYWKNKLYGSLGIPKQYLGDTDDATGFNGGTSLSLTSSRYAKEIKMIQNAYIQAITSAVNLILFERGLTEYIGEFIIKMQTPTTQEEKDRRDNLGTAISTVQNIMSLVEGIEDQILKLEILKSLLSEAISNVDVIAYIQEEIDRLHNGTNNTEGEGDDFGGGDFGGDMGGGDDFGGGTESAPMDLTGDLGDIGGEELPSPEASNDAGGEAPMESFTHNGGNLILEDDDNDLPTFDSLGVNYIRR